MKKIKLLFSLFLFTALVGLASWYGYDLIFKKSEPALAPGRVPLLPTQIPTDVPAEMREKLLQGAPMQQLEVMILADGFEPKTLRISVGDRVKWVNQDNQDHQLTDTQDRWESNVIQPGKSFTQVFDVSGTYEYSDPLDPALTGTVIVEK